ncbi:MAG: PEP/pyruvate-binding domain-containing protein [bacterium]|nr:PEP/pyruvate-binding domain-containing protein [bacterium]
MNDLLVEIDQGFSTRDRRLVGGKGLALIELSQRKIPVPPGFVLTTNAYDLFLRENDLGQRISGISVTENLEGVLGGIRKAVLDAPMPEELLSGIELFVKRSKIKRYAVRSSADVEDSAKKSWAGVFESYLNVPQSGVVNATKRCWASVFSSTVVRYAKSLGQIPRIKMAVIVQESINSDVSGVCFTRDPLDNKKDDIRIEAVFGLGEALVQGKVTPDSYAVERGSNVILEINVQPQKIAYVNKKSGGTKLVALKPRYNQKLPGEEIIRLVTIAQTIENGYGVGQDIEWCKKGGNMYILQSRPITSGNQKQRQSGRSDALRANFS